jgi:16S rRNA processing protein RimM
MDELVIGRLGAPFGLKGHVRLISYSGETAHIRKLKDITLRANGSSRQASIDSVTETSGGIAIRLAGVSSPEEAKSLNGLELFVSRADACPRGKDEYYIVDLVGCSLFQEGREVATVMDIVDGGGGQLVDARLSDGSRVLIPFRGEFIGTVDVDARRVELLSAWILD